MNREKIIGYFIEVCSNLGVCHLVIYGSSRGAGPGRWCTHSLLGVSHKKNRNFTTRQGFSILSFNFPIEINVMHKPKFDQCIAKYVFNKPTMCF